MDITPQDAMRLFLIAKEDDTRCRPSTLDYYRFGIGRFLKEVEPPQSAAQFTPLHLRQWTRLMKERGLKPRAIRSYQGAVWTWLRWLYNQDDCGVQDITRKVPLMTVREEDYTRRTATERIKRDLLTVARSRAEHPRRNAAIIEVLWATGARRSELAMCDLEDYHASEGTLRLRLTKNGEPRTVHVGRVARNALENYLIRERKREPGPLFYGRGKHRLTSDGMQTLLRRLAKDSGHKVSAHDFRRATAARILEAEAPIDVVMHQLGHKTMTMSLLYGKEGRERRNISVLRKIDEAG